MPRGVPQAGSAQGALTRDAVGGVLWMAWGKGAYAVLQILVLVVLARLLAPADFGVVSASMIVIGFSTIFSTLGLGPALVQRPTLEPRHLQTAFVASVLTGLLLGGLLWLAAPLVAGFFHAPGMVPVLRALALVFPVRGLAVVAESLIQRELRFRWLANLEVATYAIGYGAVGVALAWAGWGVWALVAANLTQSTLHAGALLALHPPLLRALPERRAFRELMYFGGGFTVARLANFAALQGDNLVVGRWLGPAALGLYGRAYQLMSVPAVLLGEALDTVLFPAMARVQEEPQRLANAYRRGVALVALLMCPLSVVLAVAAPALLTVLLGAEWSAVILPFQVLTLGMLFRTSYKLSDSLARATGAVYRRAWRQIVYAGSILGGSWIGQHWGITGVAAGVVGALTINFLLMAHLSTRLAQLPWRGFAAAHVPALRLAAVVGGSTWVVSVAASHWGLSPLAALIAMGIAALGSAATCAYAGPRLFLGRDGLWLLETLRAFVPRLRSRTVTPVAR